MPRACPVVLTMAGRHKLDSVKYHGTSPWHPDHLEGCLISSHRDVPRDEPVAYRSFFAGLELLANSNISPKTENPVDKHLPRLFNDTVAIVSIAKFFSRQAIAPIKVNLP